MWGSLDLRSLHQINLQVMELKSPEDRAGGIFSVDVSGFQGLQQHPGGGCCPCPLVPLEYQRGESAQGKGQ